MIHAAWAYKDESVGLFFANASGVSQTVKTKLDAAALGWGGGLDKIVLTFFRAATDAGKPATLERIGRSDARSYAERIGTAEKRNLAPTEPETERHVLAPYESDSESHILAPSESGEVEFRIPPRCAAMIELA